jgi:hypothetical protein
MDKSDEETYLANFSSDEALTFVRSVFEKSLN